MSQPTLTREGLAAALFSLVQALPGLQTSSRRLLHWSEVAPASQPAAFLAEGNQTPLQDASGLPSVWRYDYKIYLYAYNGDQTCSPSTLLNPIVDALEIALKPSISGPPGASRKQVLGDLTGRVQHAWISGAIETDEGVLGPQAIAIIPIEIEFV